MSRFALSLLAVILLAAGATLVVRSRLADRGPDLGDLPGLLPSKDLYTSAEIGKDFFWVPVVPAGNPKAAFRVLLPRGWDWRAREVSPATVLADNQQPVILLEAGPQSNEDALIEVRYARVPRDVSLERFVRTYAELSGHQLLGQREGAPAAGGGREQDGLYQKVSPGFAKVLTRVTVLRHGELVFIVSGSAPAASYNKWKQLFGVAATSFEPTGK